MTKAVAAGMPKLRIEEAAARRQARLDRGEDVVVGVNRYRSDSDDMPALLDVDNYAVREAQIARIAAVRAGRDEAACQATLERLTEGARGDGNLLALSIEAIRARATVGEVSDAMEAAFTRHRAIVRTVSGIYGAAYAQDDAFQTIRRETALFAEAEGRRPRILVVKLGQDGHDRGAKVIATAFADIGFDVDIGPLFQTPARGGPRCAGERRACRGRLQSGRRSQDPGAGACGGAARGGRGPRGGGLRRGDSAAGP